MKMAAHQTGNADAISGGHSTNLQHPKKSCYCEQVSITGKEIPWRENVTFAQCGIKDWDTLYLLLEDARLCNIRIMTRIQIDSICRSIGPLHVLPSTSLSNVKKVLHRDMLGRDWRRLPVRRMILKFKDDAILNEYKTFGDYNIRNDDVIDVGIATSYSISVRVPMYAKMEHVLFKPDDTIADLKNRVAMKIPHLNCTAGVRDAYPIPLRGAVETPRGTTSYIYLSLFRKRMAMFVHCNGALRGFYIGSQYTMNDFKRLIKNSPRQGERIDYDNLSRWPQDYNFGHAWTQMFAPQIEAEISSPIGPIRLFYFPLRVKFVQTDGEVDGLTQCGAFEESFSEKVFGMKGLKRAMYNPQTRKFLLTRASLEFYYRAIFFTHSIHNSVILTKRNEAKPASGDQHIMVKVQWPTDGALRSPITLKVRPTDTINSLKDEIENVIQVPFCMQKLILDAMLIQDSNRTLSEMGITNGSTLDLLAQLDFE